MNRTCLTHPACLARVLTLLASLACIAGCASWNVSKSFSWLPGMEEPVEVPASVVAVWSPAVLQQGAETPTRGFGGRLMFYSKDDRPVRVEGTLIVYAFDELSGGTVRSKADRKYVFTPEQLASHHSRSKLGSSYSVWIPWDKTGSTTQQLSLIVRFDPLGGPSIVGNQAKLSLPGPAAASSDVEVARYTDDAGGGESIRPAAHYAPLTSRDDRERPGMPHRQMSTTTIDLPPMGR